MKILIDECVPRQIKRILKNYEAFTVAEMGLSGIKNGELIKFAQTEFHVFVTSDRNMRYQQNLKSRSISIVELSTNDRDIILSSEKEILAAFDRIEPYCYIEVIL